MALVDQLAELLGAVLGMPAQETGVAVVPPLLQVVGDPTRAAEEKEAWRWPPVAACRRHDGANVVPGAGKIKTGVAVGLQAVKPPVMVSVACAMCQYCIDLPSSSGAARPASKLPDNSESNGRTVNRFGQAGRGHPIAGCPITGVIWQQLRHVSLDASHDTPSTGWLLRPQIYNWATDLGR